MKKQIIPWLILLIMFGVNLTLIIQPIFAQTLPQNETITEKMRAALKGIALPGGDNVEKKAQIIVGRIINSFLSIFGVIFMILIIYGGYKWLMASGREEEVKKAKDIIRQAIIGLIIVLGAYAISYFVTTSLQQAAVGSSQQ
ncbi:MAG TPA: hypothetical protein VJG65_03030 [Patescibacteria group bacterium]|nr:hypothetical protein [Patescibacteria group bacterium]